MRQNARAHRRQTLRQMWFLVCVAFGCMGRQYITELKWNLYLFSKLPMREDSDQKMLPRPKFDCSIHWIRVPKTASTTVLGKFMNLLEKDNMFTTTYLTENTCLVGPGGCSEYWNSEMSGFEPIHLGDGIPHFGIDHQLREMHNRIGDQLGRCFPRKGKKKPICQEYDATRNTLNFGPIKNMRYLMRKELDITSKEQKDTVVVREIPYNGTYSITPMLKGHTGLDVSLYGWLIPRNTLTFSMFRNPVQRLISSFHHGIFYGAGRPGQIFNCKMKKWSNWKRDVVQARILATKQNDTSDYQSMFREYIKRCPFPTDNAVTAFLDPLHRNLTVALQNLENHVIVGLQDNLEASLDRWTNITLDACRSHPSFAELKLLLRTRDAVGGDILNQGTMSVNSTDLITPDVASFDDDLREMIRKSVEKDEVIYKRAIELYELQSRWG